MFKNVNEDKENPQIKSIRLTAVRLVNTITNKVVTEQDSNMLIKLSAALTAINISMTILPNDYLRAARLLSGARRMASVKDSEDKEG